MFDFNTAPTISVKEFLSDYDEKQWLGCMYSDNLGKRHYSEWQVRDVNRRNFDGVQDVYLAYNPLKLQQGDSEANDDKKPRKRNKPNVDKLALLHIDLDCGRNPFLDYDEKQYIINRLEEEFFGIVVPEPNYIVSSGHGMYLLYKIYQNEAKTKQEHANAKKRWERINAYITDQLKEYYADSSLRTDYSHVIRIPNSINGGSGTQVKFHPYSSNVYTLYNIERDFINEPTDKQLEKLKRVEDALGVHCNVLNRRNIRRFLDRYEKQYKSLYQAKEPTAKQLDYAADIAKKLEIKCPAFRTAGGASSFIRRNKRKFEAKKREDRLLHGYYYATEHDILEDRMQRLERILVDARESTYREKALFLYRMCALAVTDNEKKALKMTEQVLEKMKHPLEKSDALKKTFSAERYWKDLKIHKMKDESIVRFVGEKYISLAEWKALSRLKFESRPKTDKKESRKVSNRNYYAKQLSKGGKVTKQESITLRREDISRLLSAGKNAHEICNELSISARTYYNDLKEIRSREQTEEETQNVVAISAKNSDSLSNSVPLGTLLYLFPSTPTMAISCGSTGHGVAGGGLGSGGLSHQGIVSAPSGSGNKIRTADSSDSPYS